jgi:hypothetical protein
MEDLYNQDFYMFAFSTSLNVVEAEQYADRCQPFKEGAQTALFKDPVRTAL